MRQRRHQSHHPTAAPITPSNDGGSIAPSDDGGSNHIRRCRLPSHHPTMAPIAPSNNGGSIAPSDANTPDMTKRSELTSLHHSCHHVASPASSPRLPSPLPLQSIAPSDEGGFIAPCDGGGCCHHRSRRATSIYHKVSRYFLFGLWSYFYSLH